MKEPVRVYIERLKAALDVTTDEALAEILGYSKQAIANWRRRGKVPLDAELKISHRYGAQLARTPQLRNIANMKEDEIVFGAAIMALSDLAPDLDDLPSPRRELVKGRVFRQIEGFLRARIQAKNIDYSDALSVIDGILDLIGKDGKEELRTVIAVAAGHDINEK